jgi:hypothetical protein
MSLMFVFGNGFGRLLAFVHAGLHALMLSRHIVGTTHGCAPVLLL